MAEKVELDQEAKLLAKYGGLKPKKKTGLMAQVPPRFHCQTCGQRPAGPRSPPIAPCPGFVFVMLRLNRALLGCRGPSVICRGGAYVSDDASSGTATRHLLAPCLCPQDHKFFDSADWSMQQQQQQQQPAIRHGDR